MRQKSLTGVTAGSRLTARRRWKGRTQLSGKGREDGMMWRLKGCPKCNGDVFLEKDIDGWYERCLQCGYNRDMIALVEIKEQVPGRKKEPVLQR